MRWADGTTCARPGCLMPTSERYILCRRHWWLVPRPVRDTYWRAFRAWSHGYGDEETLCQAQQAAIDVVVSRSTS